MSTATQIFVDPLVDFVRTIFKPDDIVELRCIRPDNPKPNIAQKWCAARDIGQHREWLSDRSDEEFNLYVGANPRNALRASSDANIALARSLFVDFDHCTVDEAIARIAGAGLPKPTITIDSGHGCHAYWLLAEPITDLSAWADRQKDLIALLDSDKAIHNPERIMRLPGYRNHKEPAADCTLIECDSSRIFEWAEILRLIPKRRTDSTNGNGQRVAEPIGGVINKGQRNATLASLGGSMQRRRMSADAILAALRVENATKCNPMLPDEEIRAIVKSISRYEPEKEKHLTVSEPVLTCMADVQPCEVAWLWPDRIPLGRITLLVGRPGEGKSFLTTDIAARITTGSPWPDGSGNAPNGSVLLICGEDDPADTIRPRLNAAYADAARVKLLTMVRRVDDDGKPHEVMFTLSNVRELETALRSMPDCRLIVIDPIGSFLGGSTDAHRDNEVRGVLAPVAALAQQYGPAVLVVAHDRKGTAIHADDLALGSRAFTGIARAVWRLRRDPQNKLRRLLLPGKNNLAPDGGGLAFTIGGDPPAISWERDPVEMSADDALAVENGDDDGKPGPEPVKQNAAKDWLRERLTAGSVYVGDAKNPAPGTIRADVKEAGLSWGTVRRAADELEVKSEKCPYTGKYQWRLLKQVAQDASNTENMSNEHEQPEQPADFQENRAGIEARSSCLLKFKSPEQPRHRR